MSQSDPLRGLAAEIEELRELGTLFYRQCWSAGTSGDYSVVVQRSPLELLMTARGRDKRQLRTEDFVRVRSGATPRDIPEEALLHLAIAEATQAGSILHTHSVWATELSQLYFDEGVVRIEGYEMLKELSGVESHDYQLWLEIFDNTQDLPRLADQVRRRLEDPSRPLRHGFLIRRHGLYTWGETVQEARRHVEVLEFLLECIARRRMLARGIGVVEFPNTP